MRQSKGPVCRGVQVCVAPPRMIGCIAGVVGLVDDVEGFAEGDVLSTGVLGAAARWGGVARLSVSIAIENRKQPFPAKKASITV